GLGDWCRGGLSASADASDATSGLDAIACALDDVATPCALIDIGADGAYAITAHAVDAAGNAADATLGLQLDATAPIVALTTDCATPGDLGWCLSAVTANVAAEDATSGIGSIACSVDDEPIACAALGSATDGEHALSVSAIDAAGNSASASQTALVDQTPPVLSLAQACDLAGLGDWCRGGLSASADASDATSGLDAIACALDDVATPCALIDIGADGAHSITARATDVAGNAADAAISVSLDATAPVVALATDCATPGNLGWCLSGISASVSTSDATSGLAAVTCALDGEATDCATLGASADGAHDLAATATDAAGNAASASTSVLVDRTAPTVALDLSCATPGELGWCLDASFTFAASGADATSGLAAVACAVDAAPAPCDASVSGDGLHSVSASVTDVAGNTATIERSLRLDHAGIDLSIATDCATPGNDLWCRAPSVSYTGAARAASSSVASVLCTIDGADAPCDGAVALEGMHTIAIAAVSTSGATATESATFGIDSVAPLASMTLACAQPGNAGWCLAESLGYDGLASDATSGVAGVACTVDGASAPCAGALAGEGAHGATIAVADAAGNVADASASTSIDSVAPAIARALAGTHGVEGWFRSAATVTLGCSDVTSGVAAFEYALDGGDPSTYRAPFLVAKEGTSDLVVGCADAAGNLATESSQVKVDTVAPSGSIQAPMFAANGFDVMWTASDATSGLTYVEVQALSDLGALGDVYTTICPAPVSGTSANGVCHVDTTPSYECYRVVVLDGAGNVRVGPTLDLSNLAQTTAAVTSACTIQGTAGAILAAELPRA
ncbi:MAG TPA: hypothetical protein VM370_01400, partial [Candidatus Thermoplasmatota archaeon]|nr:hypothetical protein [Candidatus Thermoplasmatota archaeon]